MKKFFKKIVLFFIFFTLCYQINYPVSSPLRLRTFIFNINGLFNNINKEEVIVANGFKVNKFNEKIKFNINNIGYNSHRDYHLDSINKGDIAVIGDSFVDSSICGIENSISFLLEDSISKRVYNFGVSGGNILDYNQIYKEYGLKNLDKVVILITGTEDLRYRNSNNQYSTEFSKIKLLDKVNKIRLNQMRNNTNYGLIQPYENVIYVLHSGIPKSQVEKHVNNSLIEIKLDRKYMYSDGHFNKEGNLEIVKNIIAELKSTDVQIEPK
ncbi:SGNH/GDSL hydrolase family protein [Aurantibacter crassamenti]|uniref:SGNH/GDSL hydrolase family protein n=1 Tax=Aurantibacter crassamenti TaxID=1837375 RepID=UPI001939FF9F|nr:SGNH/GDSL hydrolase family protein [Aurantibacter crassamenti]MBM1104649.1 SGNH/GDSL hydrolase family protein [Aurantibacter crassamenti]